MASGGQDVNSGEAACDADAPCEGLSSVCDPPHQWSQVNMVQPRIQTANFNANILNVHGPTVFNMNCPQYTPSPRYQQSRCQGDQALLEPELPEDLTDIFSEDELDRVVEERHLTQVAQSCGKSTSWQKLARKLKLGEPMLDRIKADYLRDGAQELIYQILLAWKRRTLGVKVRELVKVLCASKLQESVRNLKIYFSSVHDKL